MSKTKIVFHEDYAEKLYVFKDRLDAGRRLAQWLQEQNVSVDIVFGIPAGGVPVAFEISRILGCRLDVLVCRKILIPWNREAGFGAVAPDGTYFYDEHLATYLGLTPTDIKRALKEQISEIRRRLEKYRCGESYKVLEGSRVAVVDDGIATGFTIIAAIRFLKKLKPSKITIAVPTCHTESVYRVSKEQPDEIYCLNPRSSHMYAVADAYHEWRDLDDSDVIDILRKAKQFNMLTYDAKCIK